MAKLMDAIELARKYDDEWALTDGELEWLAENAPGDSMRRFAARIALHMRGKLDEV